MQLDTNQLLENAIRDGIREGVKSKLTGYNSPLDKLIEGAIAQNNEKFRSILADAINSCLANPEFVEEIRAGVRKCMAKTLVQRFGGEIEKQINVLKSDPTTRARITLAIEEIVKQKAS